MNISPQRIAKLVNMSFALEPLLEKSDCTTRFVDIPNKTVYDFVITGLNTGYVFEKYAFEVQVNKSKELFSHFIEALRISNEYKQKKFINVGLLEFMFVAVKSRLSSYTIEESIENLGKVIAESSNIDVRNQYNAYAVALKSSSNEKKKKIWVNVHRKYLEENSLYDYYLQIKGEFPDKTTAHYQVSNEYVNGFPILKQFINGVDESIGLIGSLEGTYKHLHKIRPEIKVGILADFCAAAMFLYLSFQNPNTYIIK